MYTTVSGVPIPQGTDSFNPPAQLRDWGDKAGTYENRVIVATDAEKQAITAPVLRKGLLVLVASDVSQWLWDGARWKRVSPTLLGVADFPQGLAGVAWTDLCTLTATSNGGMVIADWDAVAFNANSGADRAVSWRALCDGAVIGPVTAAGQTIPLAGTPRVYAGYKARSTPAAGSHTWKVQVIATAAAAVFVEFATMTVTEY